MEVPPTPLEFQVQIGQKNLRPKIQTNFKLISDKNNSFNIIFNNCSNYIQIESVFEKEFVKKVYEKILFLDELKTNRFLSICDSIDEVYEQIIMEIKNNDKTKIIEENNEIDIIIPINHIKVKEIKFNLKEKIKTQLELIQELFEEIKVIKKDEKENKEKYNKLENENKNLREEISLLKSDKNLKEEIMILKEDNKKLNDKINSLIKDNEELKNKINLILQQTEINEHNIETINDDILKESSILQSDISGLKQIKKWIKEKTNKNNIDFKLIFKMSEHGYKGKDFHRYCDNEAPTLVLIKSKDNHIFGGFTPLFWGKEERPVDKSNQTFVFSLDRNKQFDIINPNKYAIRCLKDEGPVFGNCDIKVCEDMRKIESYSKGNFFKAKSLEITGKEGDKGILETLELEVYKLIN